MSSPLVLFHKRKGMHLQTQTGGVREVRETYAARENPVRRRIRLRDAEVQNGSVSVRRNPR